MDIKETLNELLVNLFRSINTIEEQAMRTEEYKDVTTNDMHVIEAIGTGAPKNMTTVARIFVCDHGNAHDFSEQPGKKGICAARPQRRGQTGGSCFPDRKGEACLCPSQEIP